MDCCRYSAGSGPNLSRKRRFSRPFFSILPMWISPTSDVRATWVPPQGWLSIAIFLCLLLLAVNFLPGKTAQGAAAFALIAVFVTISWIKTDGGWRLGDDD